MADKDRIVGKNETTNSYVNGRGEHLKFTNNSIGIYDKDPRGPHAGTHINIDHEKGTFTVTTHNEDRTEKSSNTGNCFLTTACIKHKGDSFDDNCYELTRLRWFRDNFVSEEYIKHYYMLAPIIVEEIDKLENCDEIYKDIYENVIISCVKYIENIDYKRTYELYKKCILELEEKYARPVLNNRLIEVLKKKRDLMYIKEICCNGEQVVKSFIEENKPETEHVYRLVPNNPNETEIKVSNNNIANNARFVANLFD